MDLKNKKITVVGLGERTGVALLRYLVKGGARVFVTEKRKRDELLATWNQVSDLECEFEFGGHSIESVKGSTLAILCPGVPVSSPFVKKIKEMELETVSEIEFAYRIIGGEKLIAVTGTNGKSTTVKMLGTILKEWEKSCFIGGNIGIPLIEALSGDNKYDFYVVEVSSFQLEAVKEFKPKVGVITNISRNHLDRHKTMELYTSLKLQMFKNHKETETAILNLDDENISTISKKINSRKLYYSIDNTKADLYFEKDSLKGSVLPEAVSIGLSEFNMPGRHNIYNLMAATLAALSIDCSANVIKSALEKFEGLPHRIEFVAEIDGVEYYDDSKSTTVDSTVKAIESIEDPIILLAGGRDKGSDFESLRKRITPNVKSIVLFGEARNKMADHIGKNRPVHVIKKFEDAINKAKELACKGDVVLLSPANSSFDQFRNYSERGARFKKIVKGYLSGK